MAKKLKPETVNTSGVSAEDLKKAVEEIKRQKALASEYAGNAGKATASAVERLGLEKNALTFSRRLSEMEEGKRASVIRSNLEYWHKLGFFDQFALFDDVRQTLRQILDDIEANSNDVPNTEGAATLDALTTVN